MMLDLVGPEKYTICTTKHAYLSPRTSLIALAGLHNNDLNQVSDQRFSLKRWFATVAHSCRIRKPGSGHCYLRSSGLCLVTFHLQPLKEAKHPGLQKTITRKSSQAGFGAFYVFMYATYVNPSS